MKKYIEFLLENEQTTISGDTVQFDSETYNEIVGHIKNLWNIVFTKRNLNFDKDDTNKLKEKLNNLRYKPYFDKINAELKIREQSDVEQTNKNEKETKINSAISGLINMRVPAKNAKLIVTKIDSEQPDITLNSLITLAFKEWGKQNQKTKQPVTTAVN